MSHHSSSPLALIALLASLAAPLAASAQVSFTGVDSSVPVAVTPPASTGLQTVWVLPRLEGVSAVYTASAPGATVTWQRYSALGGGYAEEVPSVMAGTESRLLKLEPDMGYIVTEGSAMTCFWVVDYSASPMWVADLYLDTEQSDCSTAWLAVDGQAAPLTYYSVTGVPQTLSRDISLEYFTLEYDEQTDGYVQTTHRETITGFNERIHCPQPLCTTDFTLTGDRFLTHWGRPVSFTSPQYDPTAVEGHTRATQAERTVDNEQKVETALGGSAPAVITFSASVTDAAIYHQWEVASDPEFNMVTLRFNDLEFTHTFRQQGTAYVRMVADNDAGTCEWVGETYQVFIGESDIKCPNAFSPGASEGVNDQWRVSYKSIVEFECHIFNRWGQQMAHFTDPAQGWDGKNGGKTVPAGVYFYVIRARGADGKEYKLSGDINVVKYSSKPGTATSPVP